VNLALWIAWREQSHFPIKSMHVLATNRRKEKIKKSLIRGVRSESNALLGVVAVREGAAILPGMSTS
jgi:hypothetical protein